MASIVKRDGARGSTYRVRVKAKGKVRFRSFKRQTDARKWAAEVESDLNKGHHVPTVAELRRTVGDLVDQYLDDYLPTKRHGKDTSNPTRHLGWWKAQLGEVPLVDLTPDMVGKARDRLLKGKTKRGGRRTPATVNRYIVSLSHACTIARRQWGWSLHDGRNPCAALEKLPEPRGRDRVLTPQERDALLKACKADPSPVIYDMVLTAISTGMRAGELQGLAWGDVDTERGLATLRDTKNGETRVVPVRGPALEAIKARGKVRRIDNPFVFPGRSKDKPASYRLAFERSCAAAGIEGLRWHDLRHCTATWLAEGGASPLEIAAVLGHKTLAMVKRYAHVTETHTAGLLERMTAKLGG